MWIRHRAHGWAIRCYRVVGVRWGKDVGIFLELDNGESRWIANWDDLEEVEIPLEYTTVEALQKLHAKD